MERRSLWIGYLCVILSAVLFGCMPLGARFLYAQGVTPMSLVLLRNLLSLPILALLGSRQGGLRISRGALLEASAASFFGTKIRKSRRHFVTYSQKRAHYPPRSHHIALFQLYVR